MAVTDRAARLAPYVQEVVDNSDVRRNLRDTAEHLRDAYQRSQKRRVKAALVGAAVALSEALRRQARPARLVAPEAAQRAGTGAATNSQGRPGTPAELYREAQRLGIPGRSKMSKAELQSALKGAPR